MNMIICLDDNNGIAFNHRRQTKDRVVSEQIREYLKDQVLRCDPYSAELFSNMHIEASDDYITRAAKEDWCFVELTDPATFPSPPEKILLYRWNRIYPADVSCTLRLEDYKLSSSKEFAGFSHEKITMEEYIK